MKQWRRYFLMFVTLLLPWQAVWLLRPDDSQYVRIGSYATDVLMLVAVLWCGFQVWRIPKNIKKWLWTSPLLLVVYFVIVSMFSADPLLALWKLATIILLVLFAITAMRSVKRKYIRQAVLVAAILESLLAITQFFTQEIFGGSLLGMSSQQASVSGVSVVVDATSRWIRAYGTFPHPNILGGFLAIALLLVVDEYFHCYENFQEWWNKKGSGHKNLWSEPTVRSAGFSVVKILGSLMVISFGLLATFSRSGTLAFVIGFLVYGAMKYQANTIRATVLGAKIGLALVAVIVTWSMFFPDLLSVRLEAQGSLENRSVAERLSGYETAWQVFRHTPLFGTGLGQYTSEAKNVVSKTDAAFVQPVHNVFFLIIAEIGLVGVIVLCLVLWARIKLLVQYLWTKADPLTVALAVSIFIIALFDHYLLSLHAGLVLLVIAVASSVSLSDTQKV